MKLGAVIPAPREVAREALIVIGGAIIAAVIGYLPSLREWIKKQWDGAPNPVNPW